MLPLLGLPLLLTCASVIVIHVWNYFVSTVTLSKKLLQFQDFCKSSVTQNMLWGRIISPVTRTHAEGPPLSAVCDFSFTVFTATINILWPWLAAWQGTHFLKCPLLPQTCTHKLENGNKNTTEKFKTRNCWRSYYSLIMWLVLFTLIRTGFWCSVLLPVSYDLIPK